MVYRIIERRGTFGKRNLVGTLTADELNAMLARELFYAHALEFALGAKV